VNHPINTDRELYALKPQSARYERAVTKARGLSVLVYPNGCKTFVVRYVAENGARRRLAIGDYPALGLAEARLKAGALRLQVVEGKDPADERRTARREARFGETFEDLARGYWPAAARGLHGGRRRPLRPETIERQKALWARHIKPVLGSRRYKDLRRADIRAFMQGFVVEGRLSASSIASIGDVLRALYAYALHEDLVEANPALGLTRPLAPQSRARLFDEDALRQILAALVDASHADDGRSDPHARMVPIMALALRFTILTLCRRSEIAGAKWSEIDLKTRIWVIPPERTKNRQFHVVPLSLEAIEVLASARAWSATLGAAWVFPSPADPMAHIDPHAMTRAVARICKRLGLPAGSPHDFRRTGATILTGERHSIRRFIVGMLLGHTAHEGAAVTAVYDRNEYLAEKRYALDAWARHVTELVSPPDGGAERFARNPLRLVASA
jgi:integrase